MKEEIRKLIQAAIADLKLNTVTVSIAYPEDIANGDYATNVAFSLAKQEKKSPREMAEIIAAKIKESNDKRIKDVTVAGPGFINITLTDTALEDALTVEKNQSILSVWSGKHILVEFTDPNPFKELHIGHLYSNIVGQAIATLLEAVGAKVNRVNYQGDVGLHVAKAIWGMQRLFESENLSVELLEKQKESERAKFLGRAYSLGASAYETDKPSKEEIIAINKAVYEKDEKILPLYEAGRQWSLDYFETVYKRLMHTKGDQAFDRYYFESEAGPRGLEIVKEFMGKVFVESDGAIIFKGEDHGLHSRVFINSLGLPTYEAKELGLAVTKYEEYPFDLSLMITGNEINEYFKVLLKALSLIRPEIAEKMKHLSHGMVKLPEGKMSSRTGNVITAEWLLDEAVSKAKEKIEENGKDEKKQVLDNQKELSEVVGVGAVKWALLRSGIGKDVEFSFDDSVSFEGNSGPYLQYTYVRTRSVLAKSDNELESFADSYQLNVEERRLLVLLSRYSDVVLEAAEKFSPNIVTTYLFELAKEFNLFYQKHQILKETGDRKAFRLALTKKVGYTLKEGLAVLGIQSPEKM